VGHSWVVKMVRGVGGWCVVCIRKVAENEVMVVCERTNGRCELRGSMRHDKLRDMGHFVPIRKEVY
jgi:hypothetical protein